MTSFPLRVWAPNASQVEGVLAGTPMRVPLNKIDRGWWISDNVLEGVSPWPRPGGKMDENEWRGIQLTGSGHVIAYNRIHHFKDAIDTYPSIRCSALWPMWSAHTRAGAPLNVEVGASDGGTGPKTIGPTGLTIQPWGTWSASRTPCNVSVPEAVSLTRTRATRPGRMVEGARTTTWRAPPVCWRS